MPIDAWFPLVIYYVDLETSAARKEALVKRVLELHKDAEPQRTSATSAWTGDIHNVERIHCDPAFDWITEEVGRHGFEYLKQLGHDLSRIDLHIQRAWPVIAAKNQWVAKHTHPSAHLSAVYYLASPHEKQGGELRFLNESRPNELCPGIGSSMTGGYREYNFTNYQSASYQPVEGRLVIFPSKQSHDVVAHDSDEPRISLSYDLVITSREGASPGMYEFLMPPPSQWRKAVRIKE